VAELVVLTGASGILGSAFARLLPAERLVSLGRADLPPDDPGLVQRRISQFAPGLVINCAADTDVEGAEAQPEQAFAVNATLAAAVARGAAEAGAALLHFSSTGCYGDWKDTPYEEADRLRPATVHHRSKALGEERVLRAHGGALVMRLGWVFGGRPGQRKNFVWSRIAEARGRDSIPANPAQIGCPTAAADVAVQALALIDAHVSGVVNCVGGGPPARRIDYVAAILAACASPVRVVPADFVRRAPVSPNEAAVNARLQALGLDRMPPWRDSLAVFVHALLAGAAHRG
jgi:dTDP-4-dehydrorhamnose reductase